MGAGDEDLVGPGPSSGFCDNQIYMSHSQILGKFEYG